MRGKITPVSSTHLVLEPGDATHYEFTVSDIFMDGYRLLSIRCPSYGCGLVNVKKSFESVEYLKSHGFNNTQTYTLVACVIATKALYHNYTKDQIMKFMLEVNSRLDGDLINLEGI